MSIRRAITSRRAVAVVSAAAALVLTLSGCGGDDGDGAAEEGAPPVTASATPSSEDKGEQQQDTAAGEDVDPNVKLAEARGRGLTLVINQVVRDSGGFMTVQGEIKNVSDRVQNSSGWAGTEPSVSGSNPNSVAGATLVDKSGKKRYYVLRDTESRCLCTTGIAPLVEGASVPVFMQFPAPPATTTEVDFTLPTFATTSLKISG
ncbi:hypothetical protein [Streptomyces sp. AM 2-1-1]|uniref:hypothetical protein n=1 Tax=unclassified Streptomyces TaxID=2593676 RepID=UPI0023B93CF4|nr:hypothetical protein [Streptomyces sp. AM 2-1-1]WEH39932.1 hypothetical protein PZB77_10615 [Streptomyces sp. AM 2-1-1]